MAAVIGGQRQCVEDMLTMGARIDVADFKGLTVYHYAVKHLPNVIDVSCGRFTHKACFYLIQSLFCI